MKYVIESIEDNIAVLISDNNELIRINSDELPHELKEGMILEYIDNSFRICETDTAQRRSELYNKQKLIFGRKNEDSGT